MEFAFYLDAWNYARQHNINAVPVRKNWKTWVLVF